MRLLLPALLLLVGCQSAAPATPDAPQPEQPVAPAASCCPTGAAEADAEADAEACADGQCAKIELEGGTILCRLPAPTTEVEPAMNVCDAMLGYGWTGAECRGVSGCNTTVQLYPTAEQCQQAHAHCKPAAP